jgi:eukaryotic-like serine/threonine-protein kinase
MDSLVRTSTGAVVGTPHYMSPEQCHGGGRIDHRSDIYTMGCVMMTMITGRPPFDGTGTGELIVHHMMTPAPYAASRVPGLPPILDESLQRCLAKDPNVRFQTMDELVNALSIAEEQLGGTARDSASHSAAFGAAPRDSVSASAAYGAAASGMGPTVATMPPPSSSLPIGVSPPVGAAPTTLSNAASQLAMPTERTPPPRRRMGLIAAIATVVVTGTIIVAVVAAGGKERPAAEPAAAPATMATPPPPTTPAAATAPADAGVPALDAAAETLAATPEGVTAPVKTAKPSTKRTTTSRPKTGSTTNATKGQTGSTSSVDRGD